MKKKIYLEILRIIAFLCVIFNHTGRYGFDLFTVSASLPVRIISIFLANISKTGVPVFLMISGALLIPKKEGIKTLLKKRVLKTVLVLLFVSFLYYIRLYIKNPEFGFSIKYFIQLIYVQPMVTPLWFLYVYTAFLIILPLLRKMALNMTDAEFGYLAVTALVFGAVTPVINRFMGGPVYLNIPMLANGIIYPLMGYYIDAVFDPRKIFSRLKKVVSFETGRYVSAACAATGINSLVCIYLTLLDFQKKGEFGYDYIEGLIFVPAFCIFYIAKSLAGRIPANSVSARIVSYIGSCVFIIYLSEVFLREDIFINIYRMLPGINPLILFIPYALLIFLGGTLIAAVIKTVNPLERLHKR